MFSPINRVACWVTDAEDTGRVLLRGDPGQMSLTPAAFASFGAELDNFRVYGCAMSRAKCLVSSPASGLDVSDCNLVVAAYHPECVEPGRECDVRIRQLDVTV